MRIIDDYHSTNPYFNLAAEEYFLNQSKDHVCRFWQNENTVVVGKHQAMPAEVNTRVAAEKGILVARRISGGGTVYHDLGNLNFTFIQNNVNGENLIDFRQFTQPIVDAIGALGLNIKHSGRNDLLLNEFKISGNAEHLSQKLKRTLHHGTLLLESDLNNLGQILKTPIGQFEGKFVQSKRSQVTNLNNYLNPKIGMLDFRAHLCQYFKTYFDATVNPLTIAEIAAITHLASEKYATSDWVNGYSPKFSFWFFYLGNKYTIYTEKGKIIRVDGAADDITKALEHAIGIPFIYTHLKPFLVPELLEKIFPTHWVKEKC